MLLRRESWRKKVRFGGVGLQVHILAFVGREKELFPSRKREELCVWQELRVVETRVMEEEMCTLAE